MIILGVILLIVGFVASIPILWTIGIVVLVIGLVLMAGRAVGGRKRYYCAPQALSRDQGCRPGRPLAARTRTDGPQRQVPGLAGSMRVAVSLIGWGQGLARLLLGRVVDGVNLPGGPTPP